MRADPVVEDNRDTLEDWEVGVWARAALFSDAKAARLCRDLKIPLTRAQDERTGAAGAFVVPTAMEAKIISYRAEVGVFRRFARQRDMGTDNLQIPRRVSGVTAAFVGEGLQIAESQAVWDQVQLSAKKAAALTRINSELDDDAATDLGAWFVEEMAAAFAGLEDDCGFNGDGTSTYGGMLGVTQALLDSSHSAGKITATGHSTLVTVDATDLGNLAAALPEYAWPNACWFCSGFALGATFVRLGAASAGLVMTRSGPRPMFTYAGVPIVPTPKLPGTGSQTGKVVIALGDLSLAASLGSRRGVTVSATSSRYFEYDQVGIKGTERFDVVVHDLGDTSTAGPLVGLVAG